MTLDTTLDNPEDVRQDVYLEKLKAYKSTDNIIFET